MRLTSKARYAVRAVLDVALYSKKSQAVSLYDIALRQKISQSYLEQLFSKLRHKGLVESVRGPGGGYFLSKDLADISVRDIVEAVDPGSLDATSCCQRSVCQEGEECLGHDLWCGLTHTVHDYLNQISLKTLVRQHKGKK